MFRVWGLRFGEHGKSQDDERQRGRCVTNSVTPRHLQPPWVTGALRGSGRVNTEKLDRNNYRHPLPKHPFSSKLVDDKHHNNNRK